MRAFWIGLGSGAAVVAAYRLGWAIQPLRDLPAPDPANTFEAALVRVGRLQAAEDASINPVCRTVLLHHGAATGRAVVLLHGFTNCPHQLNVLAAQLYAEGANVFVPRLPRHGQLNRKPVNLHEMTCAALAASLMEAVDIACGLGREVRVLGFSFGAVLAGWLAAMRPEVDQAVLVSPSFGLTALPRALRRGYAAMLPRLRDRMIWWDPALREEKPGPPHGYLWFSRRSIGELLRMGLLVEVEARHRPPAAREIWVVENPSDAVVDSHVSASLVARWRKQGACIHLHGFTAEDGLIHDLMDPMQPGQKVDIVYPVLRRILAGQIEGRRV